MVRRFVVGTVLALLASSAGATEVEIFRSASQADFLAGQPRGVSIDPRDGLQLAESIERLVAVDEAILLSAVPHPDGWVLGTGQEGKVLLVDRDGTVSELFTPPESGVFALWCDPDGTVFAGTGPEGKVYRIADGEASEYFDPGELYVWALARDAGGALLVATGAEGKLYRVTDSGSGALVYDSPETHLRALAPRPDGSVLIGTVGEGLVVRLGADGAARTLYNAPAPEVVAFAAAGDRVYGAAVVPDPNAGLPTFGAPPPAGGAGGSSAPPATGSVNGSVPTTGVPGLGAASKPLRSEIFQIAPDDKVEQVWAFSEETVYSLLLRGDRLWVGTGLDGRVFSLGTGGMTLEQQLDERQAVVLLDGGSGAGLVVAATNSPSLLRAASSHPRRGRYYSRPLDAGRLATFGTFHWRGEAPPGSEIGFAFRSGVSPEPDDTWTPWSQPHGGREIALGTLRGRYLQWRADLESANGVSPRLEAVEISYRQDNARPRIDELTVLDPGRVLAPASFNPSDQVYEPMHPNREGIFTTLDTEGPAAGALLKKLWKRGYRSLQWRAEDPNGDQLAYGLSFRPERSGRSQGSGRWLPVAEDLDQAHFSFDVTALPDGLYRFRLEASDAPSNASREALTSERISEPVVIDHSPPELVSRRFEGTTLELELEDALNPIAEVTYSVDAGEWRPVTAADGLVDGRRERVTVEVPAGSELVLVKVMDAAFNGVTFDLSQEAAR